MFSFYWVEIFEIVLRECYFNKKKKIKNVFFLKNNKY